MDPFSRCIPRLSRRPSCLACLDERHICCFFVEEQIMNDVLIIITHDSLCNIAITNIYNTFLVLRTTHTEKSLRVCRIGRGCPAHHTRRPDLTKLDFSWPFSSIGQLSCLILATRSNHTMPIPTQQPHVEPCEFVGMRRLRQPDPVWSYGSSRSWGDLGQLQSNKSLCDGKSPEGLVWLRGRTRFPPKCGYRYKK